MVFLRARQDGVVPLIHKWSWRRPVVMCCITTFRTPEVTCILTGELTAGSNFKKPIPEVRFIPAAFILPTDLQANMTLPSRTSIWLDRSAQPAAVRPTLTFRPFPSVRGAAQLLIKSVLTYS